MCLVGGRGCYLCVEHAADVACASHAAGGDRRAHRPARPGRQTHTERRRGHRVAIHAGTACRAGHGARRWRRWSPRNSSTRSASARSPSMRSGIRWFARSPTSRSSSPIARNCTDDWPPRSTRIDQNAALIAEHLEAAGELRPPTTGTCAPARGRSTAITPRRDSVGSVRCRSPTRCPTTSPDRTGDANRAAALCCVATCFGSSIRTSSARFEELRDLCTTAGDKASLAIGMAGLAVEHVHARTSNRGVAAGCGEHGVGRVDRRLGADGGLVVHGVRRQDPDRRDWTTCCAGRRPSSISQTTRRRPEHHSGKSGRPGPGVAWR